MCSLIGGRGPSLESGWTDRKVQKPIYKTSAFTQPRHRTAKDKTATEVLSGLSFDSLNLGDWQALTPRLGCLFHHKSPAASLWPLTPGQQSHQPGHIEPGNPERKTGCRERVKGTKEDVWRGCLEWNTSANWKNRSKENSIHSLELRTKDILRIFNIIQSK